MCEIKKKINYISYKIDSISVSKRKSSPLMYREMIEKRYKIIEKG